MSSCGIIICNEIRLLFCGIAGGVSINLFPSVFIIEERRIFMKKWKIGLLGAVAMSAIMLVPVFLSGAAPGAGAAGRRPACTE